MLIAIGITVPIITRITNGTVSLSGYFLIAINPTVSTIATTMAMVMVNLVIKDIIILLTPQLKRPTLWRFSLYFQV